MGHSHLYIILCVVLNARILSRRNKIVLANCLLFCLHTFFQQIQKLVTDIMISPDHAIEVRYMHIIQWQKDCPTVVFFNALAFATSLCSSHPQFWSAADEKPLPQLHASSLNASRHIRHKVHVHRSQQKPKAKLIAVYCICWLIDEGTTNGSMCHFVCNHL